MLSILMPIREKWWSYRKRHEAKKRRAEQLGAMAASADPRTRQLAQALRQVADGVISDEERRAFDRIESLRKELVNSTESVEVVDFGAGEPGDDLTKEQMEAGRIRTFTLKHLCEHTSQRHPWSHLMSKMVTHTRPGRCLELGTCIGMSGSYLLAGLAIAGHGSLITLEGAPPFAQIAKRNFEQLGFSRYEIVVGQFQDTLRKVLMRNSPIGLAYIDGHHDGDATIAYFKIIAEAMQDGGLFLFDDIKWYESMGRAWKSIAGDARSQLVIDLGVMGIVGVGNASTAKESFEFSLYQRPVTFRRALDLSVELLDNILGVRGHKIGF